MDTADPTQPREPRYASPIEAEVARLRLTGMTLAAIRTRLGLSFEELRVIRKAVRRQCEQRALLDARHIIRLHANRRVELARLARDGDIIEDEVFGAGPLPRNSSPALTEDGDVALPPARVLDAEELCEGLLLALARVI